MSDSLFDDNLFDALHKRAVDSTPKPFVPAGMGGDDVLAASGALAATATVPGMHRPFLPHQAAAFLYVLGAIVRWGCALLGHDMGLGKTQVLLASIAHRLREVGGYAIMIAPPVAITGYRDDLAAAFPGLRMEHLRGRKPTFTCPRCHTAIVRTADGRTCTDGAACGYVLDRPDADIYFVSDDPLTVKAWLTDGTDVRGRTIVSAFAAGASILTRDEIHRDKGNMGKPTTRAKVMMAVGKALRDRNVPIIGATGTILLNRPVEAYLPLQIIGGTELVKAVTPGASSAYGFMHRYCDPVNNGFGFNYNGCNVDRMHELHEYLRRTVYARVEKGDLPTVCPAGHTNDNKALVCTTCGADVIATVPHGGFVITPIALNGVLDRALRLEKEFLQVVIEEEGPEAAMRKSRMLRAQQMFAIWTELAAAKAKAAAEYIEDLLDQGHQVVVFYERDPALIAMGTALAKVKVGGKAVPVGIINGKVTGEARDEAVRDFQAGRTKVLLAHTQAAGMAVTLTAAAHAVFLQCPWSAGMLKQACDRILRVDDISRERAARGEGITWHVLQACYPDGKPTFDGYLWSVLEHKARICDAVAAGRPITMSDDNVLLAVLQAWYADHTKPSGS